MSRPHSPWSRSSGPCRRSRPNRLGSRTGAVADALIYLADTVEVSRGGWFETYNGHPGAGTAPSPWAIAANVGFVTAVAAGGVAVDEAGMPEVFDEGYERERALQLDWLTRRLDLEPL